MKTNESRIYSDLVKSLSNAIMHELSCNDILSAFHKNRAAIDLALKTFGVERLAAFMINFGRERDFSFDMNDFVIAFTEFRDKTAFFALLEKKLSTDYETAIFERYEKMIQHSSSEKHFIAICDALSAGCVHVLRKTTREWIDMHGEKGLAEMLVVANLVSTSTSLPGEAKELSDSTGGANNWLSAVFCDVLTGLEIVKVVDNTVRKISAGKTVHRISSVPVEPETLADEHSPQYKAIMNLANTQYFIDNSYAMLLKNIHESGSLKKIVDTEAQKIKKNRKKGEAFQTPEHATSLKHLSKETVPVLDGIESGGEDTPVYLSYKHCGRFRIYSRNFGIGSTTHEIGRSLIRGDVVTASSDEELQAGIKHYYCALGEYLGLKADSFDEMAELVGGIDYLKSWKNDPFKYFSEIVDAADKPFALINALLQWDNVHAGHTNLLVPKDASCSGVGIIAALLNNTGLLKSVNLIDNGLVKRDLYMEIAGRVYKALTSKKTSYKYETQGDEEKSAERKKAYPTVVKIYKNWYEKAKNRSLCRAISKPCVMVIGYGGSRYGVKQQIKDALKRKHLKALKRHNLSAGLFSQIIGDIFFDICEGKDVDKKKGEKSPLECLTQFIILLKDCGEALKSTNKPTVAWDINDVFVTNSPKKQIEADFKGTICLKNKIRMSYNIKKAKVVNIGEPDPDRIVTGMSPLFIHSIDSYLLSLVINRCAEEGIKVLTVHDSIYSNPVQTERVLQIIREVYADTFAEGENLLVKFVNYVNETTGSNIKIPEGLMSDDEVTKEDYLGALHVWS